MNSGPENAPNPSPKESLSMQLEELFALQAMPTQQRALAWINAQRVTTDHPLSLEETAELDRLQDETERDSEGVSRQTERLADKYTLATAKPLAAAFERALTDPNSIQLTAYSLRRGLEQMRRELEAGAEAIASVVEADDHSTWTPAERRQEALGELAKRIEDHERILACSEEALPQESIQEELAKIINDSRKLLTFCHNRARTLAYGAAFNLNESERPETDQI